MFSRESVWPKIFKLSPPTKDDVALYFRCEVHRHKENYSHFVQHIVSHDYALQGYVSDVELLLFTSAQLQFDSPKFGEGVYLWGVFRHVKPKKVSYGEEKAVSCSPSTPTVHRIHGHSKIPLDVSSTPSTPTVHLTHGHSKIPLDVSSLKVDRGVDMLRGSSLEVDMEIDMAGGCPIGRIDVPIKLEDAPFGFSKPIQRSPVSFSLKKSTNSHLLDTPPGFPIPAYKRSPVSFSLKKSTNSNILDTPPGFPIPAYKRSVPAPGKPTKDLVSSNTN